MTHPSGLHVWKFGGASLYDAPSFRRVASLLKASRHEKLLVIVSALGKTTNALEKVATAYYGGQTEQALTSLHKIHEHHRHICHDLFSSNAPIFSQLEHLFGEAAHFLQTGKRNGFDYVYDQIVSVGELASSRMLAALLQAWDVPIAWFDVRKVLITDDCYREANIDWTESQRRAAAWLQPELDRGWVCTQGFVGCSKQQTTTTLGREGSDFSAAALAFLLDAEQVTIWKDVPGVFNADPKVFPHALRLPQLTYREAIEMTYYGAQVIHPKTLKPLQNKSIPLYVRSFLEPSQSGTCVSHEAPDSYPPLVIVKPQQILLSLYPRDVSFINESLMRDIYVAISAHRVRLNVVQQSALSFSFCADNDGRIRDLVAALRKQFTILENDALTLLTVRHYQEPLLEKLLHGASVYLEQKSRQTVQIVLRPPNPWSALYQLTFT